MCKPRSRCEYKISKLVGAILFFVSLAACSPSSGTVSPTLASDPSPLPPTVTPRLVSVSTSTPVRLQALPTASPTPIQKTSICSPFPGASQADLVASISNPFNPPPPGSDDPHQGVDIAVQQDGLALAGGPVLAVLGGTVAMVTDDRFPYGFSLLVETSLDDLPLEWLAENPALTPASTRGAHPSLTCPVVTPAWNEAARSLYLLYAHLQEKPIYQPDQRIDCGELVGHVGQSGNALNPHLHLEARLGPAGARFVSMAHYDNSAQPEEMGNYCLWRVSNVFQLIDPMLLVKQLP
jgi:murein DD-endopeptidase MepM/ murein hydrolase activator NlpD